MMPLQPIKAHETRLNRQMILERLVAENRTAVVLIIGYQLLRRILSRQRK